MSATDAQARTHYGIAEVDGFELFYREAGDPSRPTLVLLHGFPASSFMYRELIAAISDEYHLLAPDHLGFGRSATPPVSEVDYTFDLLASLTAKLLDRLGIDRFALYMQDYGAPIGLRMAHDQPARITALISQNGNAYEEGFTPFWEPLFAYAEDGIANAAEVRASMDPPGTRWVYTHGVPEDRLDRVSPDNWILDQAGLDRPGNRQIQLALFRDYRFNLDRYPEFQEYFRRHRPPTLLAWGEHDEIFGPEGARAYRRDLPEAELHLLDAGHFALESHGPEIADLTRDFLGRVLA
jgi:pimeloyl-ACP methyl ester carboxylesterase